MDREFMRDFFWTYYEHPYSVAVEGSEAYKEKKAIREQIEDQLTELLGGTRTAGYKIFDDFLDAYADEMNVMLEEVYLLGAQDREKMLK